MSKDSVKRKVKTDWWIQVASFFPKDDTEKFIYTLCKSKEEAESCVDKHHVDMFHVRDAADYDKLEAECARLRAMLERTQNWLVNSGKLDSIIFYEIEQALKATAAEETK